MAVKGLWNIGGVNLPDLGINEFFGIGPQNAAVSPSQMSTWTDSPVIPAGTKSTDKAPASLIRTPTLPPTAPTTKTVTGDQPSGGQPSGPSVPDLTSQLRGEIDSGYNDYFAQLDNMMNTGLVGQKQAQEGIISNQYNQGVNDLNLQQNQGISSLETEATNATQNQAKNLRDLSENIRNMFMAGNVMLGSRGAGDSSAANQYSYALNKMGNQQRGNVMSQTSNILAEIGKRTTMLKDTVANEIKRLGTDRDNKILEVSNWFNQQQNAIAQMKANGQLSRSQDLQALSKTLLQSALNKLSLVDQEAASRRSMLDQWAMNNAKTIGELKANLQTVAGYSPQLPQTGQIQGTPSVDARGNMNVPLFFGGNTSEDKLKTGL